MINSRGVVNGVPTGFIGRKTIFSFYSRWNEEISFSKNVVHSVSRRMHAWITGMAIKMGTRMKYFR